MKNQQLLKSTLITFLSLSVLSACGSNGITGENVSNAQDNGNNNYVPPVDNGGGFAAYPFAFSLAGMTAQTITPNLDTDNLLRVKVRAEAATRNQNTSTPTNFVSNYKCAIYKITMQVAHVVPSSGIERKAGAAATQLNWVTLPSRTTQPLSVPGTTGCAGSLESETFDFSSYLNAGQSAVRIIVQALETDFTCNLPQYAYCTTYFNQYGTYPNTNQYGFPITPGSVGSCQWACPLMPPTNVATVNGNLEIQINATNFQ